MDIRYFSFEVLVIVSDLLEWIVVWVSTWNACVHIPMQTIDLVWKRLSGLY